VAPALDAFIAIPPALRRGLRLSREGNTRLWTLRLAHGVCDFLIAWAASSPRAPVVVFENADAADVLDRELIAVLLRRAPAETLSIVVSTAAAAPHGRAPMSRASSFHVDPSETSARRFADAAAACMRMAWYDACLELARRGAALADPRSAEHAELGRQIVFSLLLLDRHREVERFCAAVEQTPAAPPALRSHCAYAMAILHARLYEPARRDPAAARAWIEKAIAFNALTPPSQARLVNDVFLHNTLALVVLRTGRPAESLRLLTAGLRRLRREAPGRHRVESTILLHNRARLHVAAGRVGRAIRDLTTLLAHEPSNSEAYLDRGILRQRQGRLALALADYDAAIAWSPPYDTAHFNRAQALAALGRTDEATAAFTRVLELSPEHAGALVNRARLRLARGELAAAREDARRVLARDARNAKALTLLGLVDMGSGRPAAARRAFDAALASDPTEATAWINRATLSFQEGDAREALRDLDRAIALGDEHPAASTARDNRSRILRALGRRRGAPSAPRFVRQSRVSSHAASLR
jgi:tetratricopeptide (TPR) repeat protein